VLAHDNDHEHENLVTTDQIRTGLTELQKMIVSSLEGVMAQNKDLLKAHYELMERHNKLMESHLVLVRIVCSSPTSHGNLLSKTDEILGKC
jgi:hypothetical protein